MHRIVSFLVILSLLSYGAVLPLNAKTSKQALGDDLEGVVTLDQVENHANLRWKHFEPEDLDAWNKTVQRIHMTNTNAQLRVFFGTWCHDSEREIPRLLRLLNDLDNRRASDATESGTDSPLDISWFALDEKKQKPEKEVKAFRVTYTPTLILHRSHSEIGRIVERPASSLETDLQRLLEGSARGLVSASEGAILDYLRPPKPAAFQNVVAYEG